MQCAGKNNRLSFFLVLVPKKILLRGCSTLTIIFVCILYIFLRLIHIYMHFVHNVVHRLFGVYHFDHEFSH